MSSKHNYVRLWNKHTSYRSSPKCWFFVDANVVVVGTIQSHQEVKRPAGLLNGLQEFERCTISAKW